MNKPEASGKQLSKHTSYVFNDPQRFRSLTGALQYLTLTRPNIAHVVNQVCKFMHTPTTEHWKAAKRILRYIKGTIHYGLKFRRSNLIRLQVCVNSDWAGDPDDRRSTTGSCIYVGSNLVTWMSLSPVPPPRPSIGQLRTQLQNYGGSSGQR